MPHPNPNFDQYLRDAMSQMEHETNTPRPGIIQSYNPVSNTATVLLVGVDSDVPHQVLTDVICPVYMGIQMAAPDSGRPCWVAFKGGVNDNKAIIVSYFNHNYQRYDYAKQTIADSGVPGYMLGL